jgi:hypothetical protein
MGLSDLFGPARTLAPIRSKNGGLAYIGNYYSYLGMVHWIWTGALEWIWPQIHATPVQIDHRCHCHWDYWQSAVPLPLALLFIPFLASSLPSMLPLPHLPVLFASSRLLTLSVLYHHRLPLSESLLTSHE